MSSAQANKDQEQEDRLNVGLTALVRLLAEQAARDALSQETRASAEALLDERKPDNASDEKDQ